MLAHRIAAPRVLRLVRMWLEAGILESDGGRRFGIGHQRLVRAGLREGDILHNEECSFLKKRTKKLLIG